MADLAQWRAAATRRIFQVTLSREEAERSDWSLTYLKELAEELRAENGDAVPPLCPEQADRILTARLLLDPTGDVMSDDGEKLQVLASLDENSTSWDWLVGCWRRCRLEEGKVRKDLGPNAATGQSDLDAIRTLLTSYMGLVLQDSSAFPKASKGSLTVSSLSLLPSLLKESTGSAAASDPYASSSSSSAVPTVGRDSWATIDADDLPLFLRELTERFADDGIAEIIEPVLCEITRRVRDGRESEAQAGEASGSAAGADRAMQEAAAAGDVQAVLARLLGGGGAGAPPAAAARKTQGMTIDGLDWRSHMTALVECADVKPLAAVIAILPSFNPADATAATFELNALLGPLLRLSCFSDVAPGLAMQYFPEIKRRGEVETGMSSLRSTLALVHNLHFRLLNSCVRAGPQGREGVVGFLARACELNKRRGVMRVKAREVATDGFMVNLFETALRFSEPFMDPKYSKIDRIDSGYLRRQKRYDVSTLTRLSADEAEAKKWSEEGGDFAAPPNFITEIYYITLRLSSLGMSKALRNFNERAEELHRMKKRADEYEADRATWSTDPNAAQYEAFIKKARADCQRSEAIMAAAETQLLEPSYIDRVLTFTSFVMTWLVRMADPLEQHPQKEVQLPLPKEVPERFRMLPEHIFEDVCETLIFLGRYKPNCLPEAVKNDLITFCVTFLSSGWYIKNPFLKAKLAEILYFFVLPYGSQPVGFLGELLNFHKLALKHLVPAIMSFWVEAESTGSHTQFFDKFNIRYHLAMVLKVVWKAPAHKERLHAEAQANVDSFIVFVNRLLNDVTFLLDDALERLAALHKQQLEIDDTAAWEARTQEDRTEHEGHMRSNAGYARSMLQFGHTFLGALIDFSAEDGRVRDAFMQPEIVSRLAPMLDHTLDTLAGPRCQELKVKDPKKAGFDPKQLLRQILSVFLNFAPCDEFAEAMARDERSYRRSVFEKAASIAERHMLKSPPELEQLMALVARVDTVQAADLAEEEDLGEIPDDFTDPLMATLMKNPVQLPSSRAIVDLSTIKSHLLSDANDPFNRVPLKIEDVIPATELKAQITAWLAERKKAKADADAAAAQA